MWTVLKFLCLLVGSWYAYDAAVNLMTYPSDLTFIGGLGILGLLIVGWLELGYHLYKKWEKAWDEPKHIDIGDNK